MTWQDRAACKDKEAIFDGKEGKGNTNSLYPRLKEARAICASCPVKTECLEHALSRNEYGIWAGTTENERDRIRKQRRRGEAA